MMRLHKVLLFAMLWQLAAAAGGEFRSAWPPWGEPGTPADGKPRFEIPIVQCLTNNGCGPSEYLAMRIATSHVNRRDATLCPAIAELKNDFEISYIFADSEGTPSGGVRGSMAHEEAQSAGGGPGLRVVLGAAYSSASKGTSSFLNIFNVPMLSWSATSGELSNKGRYPNFFRVVAPDSLASLVIATFILEQGFSRATCMYFDSDYQMALATDFQNNAQLIGLEPIMYRLPASGDGGKAVDSITEPAVKSSLLAVRSSMNRIVFASALAEEAASLWDLAYQDNMVAEQGWIWIGPDGIAGQQMAGKMERALQFKGTLYFFPAAKTERFQTLSDQWAAIMPTADTPEFGWMCAAPETDCYSNSAFVGWDSSFRNNLLCESYTPLAYDDLVTIVVVLDRLMTKTGKAPDAITSEEYMDEMKELSVTPLTCLSGTILLDANQDRLMPYDIFNWQGDLTSVTIGQWTAEHGFTWKVGENIIWPDLTTHPIVSETVLPGVPSGGPPPCSPGFDYSVALNDCQECAVGKSSRTGTSACAECMPGTFANESGLSLCKLCEPAHFSSAGSTECIDCPAGRAIDQAGASECAFCYPGSYAPRGSATCILCDKGFFSIGSNASRCDKCFGQGDSQVEFPLTTLNKGSTSEEMCACGEGTVSTTRGATCQTCPEAMDCPYGSAIDQIQVPGGSFPIAKVGYMTLAEDPLFVYKCFDPAHCPGGPPGTCDLRRDTTAPACGKCEDGTYSDGGQCTHCQPPDFIPMVLGMIASGACAVVLVWVKTREAYHSRHDTTALVVMLGVMLTSMQTLGLFANLVIDTFEPIKSLLKIASTLSFDVSILRGGCMLGNDPVTKFASRCMICPMIGLFMAVVLRVKVQVEKTQSDYVSHLVNSLGYLVNLFVLPILISGFMPLLCYSHPTKGSSMVIEPAILCFDNSKGSMHTSMVLIGFSAFLLVPVPFFAVVAYAVSHYPAWVRKTEDVNLLMKRYRFLFFKFRPERYYYGCIMIARSLAIVIVPIVIRDDVPAQVLTICIVVGAFLLVQQTIRPWRSGFNNICDGLTAMALLLMLVTGSMTADLADSLGSIKAIWSGVILASCLSGALALVVLTYTRLQPTPWYHIFLCYHRTEAAAQVRLVKLLLQAKSNKKVFLDADTTESADEVFDLIKTRAGSLVAYLTRDTLRRGRCVGEVTTAWLSKVTLNRVVCPGFLPPTPKDVEALFERAGVEDGESCNLGLSGLLHKYVVPALENLLAAHEFPFPKGDGLGLERFASLAASIASTEQIHRALSGVIGTSQTAKKDVTTDSLPSGTFDSIVAVSADADSDEAVAAAGVLINKIRKPIQQAKAEIVLFANQTLSVDEKEMIGKALCGVVILAPGTLSSVAQLQSICLLMRARQISHASAKDGNLRSCFEAIPLTCPGFVNPTAAFYDQLLPKIWQGYELREEIILSLQDFFGIASSFFTTASMDWVLETQAREVLSRMPPPFGIGRDPADPIIRRALPEASGNGKSGLDFGEWTPNEWV